MEPEYGNSPSNQWDARSNVDVQSKICVAVCILIVLVVLGIGLYLVIDNGPSMDETDRSFEKYRIRVTGVIVNRGYSFGYKSKERFVWYSELRATTVIPEVTSIVGWERGVPTDTKQYIEPVNDTLLITGKDICGGGNLTLVILVTTAPASFSQRAVIRDTWGSYARWDSRVRIAFFLGATKSQEVQKSVERESNTHQDMIQDNFNDTYNNLTLKSIALLKWFVQHCPNSSFLMKSDADTFVNVDKLVGALEKYPTEGVLAGYLCPKCGVRRRFKQAWAVPRYMYPNATYPDFIFGGAYFMSRDVAGKLFAAALETPLFYLEDVYITGLCARAAGVTPKQFPGSSTYVYKVSKNCFPNLTICHPIYADQMRELWRKRWHSNTPAKTMRFSSKSQPEEVVETKVWVFNVLI